MPPFIQPPAASEEVIGARSVRKVPWPTILIAIIACTMLAVEAGSRLLVPRISRIEGRTWREHKQVIRPPSGKPVFVVLGNSLLDAAVQFDSVREALGGVADVRRYVVEQTSYRDWQFGLRRLFSEGMRPSVVLLVLAPEQVISDAIRGDYSANKMMRTRDILEVARVLHMHPTEASTIMFANFSSFYGLREDIRKVLLGRLMPEIPRLTQMMVATRPVVYSEEQVRRGAAERLRALAETCSAHGAGFALVLPPKPKSVVNLSLALEQAARSAGISVLRPWTPGQFTSADFPDGYHLKPEAAPVFTQEFIEALKAAYFPAGGSPQGQTPHSEELVRQVAR